MNEGGGTGDARESCGEILDLLSIDFSRSLNPEARERTERHLARCASCAADLRFMARVFGARPHPPRSLATAALAQYESELSRPRNGWWSGSIAAAAVLVLAMGVGLATQVSEPASELAGWTVSVELEEYEWSGEEWFIAGAPYLEGVSDETLLALLTEGEFE